MEIKELNRDEYVNFLQTNEHHLFIHPNWLDLVVENQFKLIFQGVYDNGRLVDVFPQVVQNGRLLNYITTPMFTPHLGTTKVHHQIHVLAFLQKQNAASISYPFFLEMDGVNALHTFQLDLSQNIEELQGNLRSDKKRNIKKAVKENLKVTIEKDIRLLFPLIEKTFHRQKHSFSGYNVLENIINNFPNVLQVNVWDDQECIASSLVVYDEETAFYLIGGFDATKEKHYAGPYALWSAILACKEMDIKVFDFEGSMIPSIATYFESFGAQMKKYAIFSNEKWYFKMMKTLVK